mmetsp:Transcript_2067/g.7455  ORF Transcript_2067/g.7455 Transcript_2067/m.7455 type:complete len:1014 (-) Transcript_2067:94-3135(-)|eukprot:CAMPEP_0117446256 /NCGR_PEP_ID=MMETSP0759-20121206/6237_1 /TAXON_ID=63605 /ORGANISM="Percolomonas cosmopolitus, Strain WS" /LENGTH=1013 /DNA_ID=CAMNT_0005238497 /DNA_START=2561 /DNA_END=5602 /DNA_ORIENTATION=-
MTIIKPQWISPSQIVDLLQRIYEQTRLENELSAGGSPNASMEAPPSAVTAGPPSQHATHETIPIMRDCLTHIPPLPSILVYPSHAPSSHKKDHLKFKKKNHNRTIKESYRRISVEKKPRIACYYAKAENNKIERRCFKDLENDRFIIVQYCVTDDSVFEDLKISGRWVKDEQDAIKKFDVTGFLKPKNSTGKGRRGGVRPTNSTTAMGTRKRKKRETPKKSASVIHPTPTKTRSSKQATDATHAHQHHSQMQSPARLHALGSQQQHTPTSVTTPTRSTFIPEAQLHINTAATAHHAFSVLASPQSSTTPNSSTQMCATANGIPVAFSSPHTPSSTTAAPSPFRLPSGIAIMGGNPLVQRSLQGGIQPQYHNAGLGGTPTTYSPSNQSAAFRNGNSPVAYGGLMSSNHRVTTPRNTSNSVSPVECNQRKRKRTANHTNKKSAKRRLSITTPFSNIVTQDSQSTHAANFDMLDIDSLHLNSPLSPLDSHDNIFSTTNRSGEGDKEHSSDNSTKSDASSMSTHNPTTSQSAGCSPLENPNSVNSPVIKDGGMTPSHHTYSTTTAGTPVASGLHPAQQYTGHNAEQNWKGCEINFNFLQQQQQLILQRQHIKREHDSAKFARPTMNAAGNEEAPFFADSSAHSTFHHTTTPETAPFSDSNAPHSASEHHDNVFGSTTFVGSLQQHEIVNSTTTPTRSSTETVAFPPPPSMPGKSSIDNYNLSELEVKMPMEDVDHHDDDHEKAPHSPLSCSDDTFSMTFLDSPLRDSSTFFEAIEFEKVESFRIIDYSPSKLEVGGEVQKVIIVVENKGDFHYNPDLVYNFECVFGPFNVPAEPLTPNYSAFRCYLPELPPFSVGTMDMFLQLGSTRVSNTVKFQFLQSPQIEGLVSERLAEAQLHERIIKLMDHLSSQLHLSVYSPSARKTESLEGYVADVIQKCFPHCTNRMYNTLFSTDDDGLNMIHYASGLGWIDTVSVLMNLRQRYEKYAQLKANKDRYQALLVIQKHVRSWIDRKKKNTFV